MKIRSARVGGSGTDPAKIIRNKQIVSRCTNPLEVSQPTPQQ
jgi:hypothetical protein